MKITKDNTRPVLCQCPTCYEIYEKDREILETALEESIELEGGVSHPLENLEEVRLFLKSFLKPEVLQALVDLLDGIDTEPKETEMFSWFCRNSQYGKDCKYALAALKRFKERRLEGTKNLLKRALEALEDI